MRWLSGVSRGIGELLVGLLGCAIAVVVIGGLGWGVEAIGVASIWVTAVVLVILAAVTGLGWLLLVLYDERYPYGIRFGRGR